MESGSNAGSVPGVLDSHGGKQGKAPQTELFVAAAHGLSHASRTAARSGHATALDQGDCWRPGGAAGSAVKGLAMPHPAGDVDACIKLAVETKVNWKQLVKPVLTHVGSSALETGETVRFPECHKDFFIKGLGALRARGAWCVQGCQDSGRSFRCLPGVPALLSLAAKNDPPH